MKNIDKKDEIEFDMCIESSNYRERAQKYLEQNKVALEDLDQLNFKIYGALKRAGFDFIYQIFLLSDLELSKLTGITLEIANSLQGQIKDYLKRNKDKILVYSSNNQILDDTAVAFGSQNGNKLVHEVDKNNAQGRDFYENHKERVIEFVRANDIPIEKMFSHRLTCLLSSKYVNLSDLIFVDENTLRSGCGISSYYAEIVMKKVDQYLNQNYTLISNYCNGDHDADNSVNEGTIFNNQKFDKAIIVPLSKKEIIETEYYVVDGQSLSVFNCNR